MTKFNKIFLFFAQKWPKNPIFWKIENKKYKLNVSFAFIIVPICKEIEESGEKKEEFKIFWISRFPIENLTFWPIFALGLNSHQSSIEPILV